jgi:hypothetical protein
MRTGLALLVVAVLAGCTQPVPESGVGFSDYPTYLRNREAALRTGAPPPVPPGSAITGPGVGTAPLPGAPVAGGFSTELAGNAIARAETGAAPAPATLPPVDLNDPNRPRGDAPLTIRPESGEVQGNAGISDEQDFSAVSSRETIESDAERLARARAQYEVVQPTAVPQRPGGETGSSLVEFALQTSHAPGTPVYRRSGIRLNSDPLAKCGPYASADLAQEDFLRRGGPERDPRGIDPDGDGFACGWDPRPFRAAKQ